MGPKGLKCWPQASAGDYKGAQPLYLADKRPEGALSASSIIKICTLFLRKLELKIKLRLSRSKTGIFGVNKVCE